MRGAVGHRAHGISRLGGGRPSEMTDQYRFFWVRESVALRVDWKVAWPSTYLSSSRRCEGQSVSGRRHGGSGGEDGISHFSQGRWGSGERNS